MKKIISLMLVLCMSALCFISCGSIESYEKKLDRAGYDVEVLDNEDVEEFASMLGLKSEDYKIKSALSAESEDEKENVVIFECDSKDTATKFAEDISKVLKYIPGDTKAESDGAFVLIGTEEAIKDAK